ncbi:hypothetical protein C8K11_1071 [Novosphingobium sp. GV055]|nr:hypothetical protein C8K11_1071 [Novosphingobium sp. GV055]PUB02967.1 hypothetical protein C8K12_1071 [Novosphingobium sp. GV061]PUB19628.1 hypothetical protein C8K14_1071 [Novosphingobium sp. GV079]PUB41267.1 hypothetical protein C8K10_1071 [Novosphingobium sp. GV027]
MRGVRTRDPRSSQRAPRPPILHLLLLFISRAFRLSCCFLRSIRRLCRIIRRVSRIRNDVTPVFAPEPLGLTLGVRSGSMSRLCGILRIDCLGVRLFQLRTQRFVFALQFGNALFQLLAAGFIGTPGKNQQQPSR